MTEEDIEKIGKVVAIEMKAHHDKAVEEGRGSFWIENETHFLDHELLKKCRGEGWQKEKRKNHDLVTSVRQSTEQAKRVIVKGSTWSVFVFIVMAVWLLFKDSVNGGP